ncbi:hypothetical protein [Merdimonas faecis]|uniref:hypothetical protein n=1 Tax=Merdimonas faecis TaxID=1653435 RepID=UPI0023F7A253|nr:hypothetical protein [Merdimonas faecis]
MRIEKVEFGIHTIELYAKDLKYQEVQKVIDRLTDNGSIRKMRSDPYNIDRHLTSTFLVDDGIRLRIHQSHNKSNGIALIVNPSTLLSRKYQPTKLYHPKKKSCEELLERGGAALIKIGIGTFDSDDVVFIVPPDELSLSQMDLTVNLWFDDETDLEEIIRLFWKGKVPKNFSRQGCLSDEEHQHYFGISNHTVTFKAYDKIYELEKNGRCPKELTGHKLLRLEVSLKREAFLKKLGVQRKDCLYKMLKAGFQFVQEIISHYLEKLFPCSGAHVRYKTAKKKILDCVEKPVLQDQMLFLLKKTSDGAGMDTAAQKLKDCYKYVKTEQVLDEFEHLGISPITLTNNSSATQLSSLRNLLE